MKTIFIVRHAKSSWEDLSLSDEQRPLLKKGVKRTGQIAGYLLEKKVKVDYIMSSHAVRALETAKILANALNYPLENIEVVPQIYHSNGDMLFEQFYSLPDNYESAMIVGHNPAFTSFANYFMKPMIDNLPTSGVVSVSFKTDHWNEIPSARFNVNFCIYPKMLG